jgi:hypothetical protein
MLCHAAWHWTGLLACHPLGVPGVVAPLVKLLHFRWACEKVTALKPSRKASKKSRVTRPPHAAAHASKAVRTHCTAPLLHMLKAIRPVAGASGAPALPRPGSNKERAAHARTSKSPVNYLKTSRCSADKHSVRWAGANPTPRLPLVLYSAAGCCWCQS